MTMVRKLLRVAILLLSVFLLPTGPAGAADRPVYTGLFSNLAVGGYDPVAYFTDNRPIKGDSRFATEYKGAQWHFASAANRDRFMAEPQRYAPQYGGYCAWAVSEGGTASADPRLWKIVDGKLYLNYDADVQKKWEKDIAGHIRRADANWPAVLGK
jgi:YHS domain-containing protein